MGSILPQIRKPVRRSGAEEYTRIVLITFAATVIVIRLYLRILDYPQISAGGIHIAHVLFGGFFLFFASLGPLVLSNRWVYPVSALFTGIGTGFFIDELGKFITQNNNYFYPPAMPIIYAFLLLIVIFYVRLKRPPSDEPRYNLFQSLDALEEVIDADLDKHEYKELVNNLKSVVERSKDPSQVTLAKALLQYLKNGTIKVAEDRKPNKYELLVSRFTEFSEKPSTRNIYRLFLIFTLGLSGGFAFADLILLGRLTLSPEYLAEFASEIFIYGEVISNRETIWFLVRLGLEGIVGIFFLVAARYMVIGKEKKGTTTGYYGLLISLTTLNLLAFYFDQFRAVIGTMTDYVLLLAVVRYRELYLFNPKTLKRKQFTT